MIHIFKNLNFGGLVALALGAVLMVSWTNYEVKKSASDWYQISLIDEEEDADDLSNQRIDGLYPGGEPTGECGEGEEVICAALLDITPGPFPNTMHEADSLSNVSIVDDRFKD